MENSNEHKIGICEMDTCPHTLDIPHDKEAALNALEEKERLSIAMSSYYMLYR